MYSLMIVALIAAGSAIAGFGGGWAVNGWRIGVEIAALQSRDAVVTAANVQCETDVITVKAGVKEVTDALAEKKKAADAAMKDAQFWAGKHSRLAQEVNAYQALPGETQCQTIEREQIEYVQSRRTDS